MPWMAAYNRVDVQEPDAFTLEYIMEDLCKIFDVTKQEINSRSRKERIRTARQFMHFTARLVTGNSFARIGMYFGLRDHCTAMHSCKVIASEMEYNSETYKIVEDLCLRYQIPLTRVFNLD
jgi:chromosomal replication initiator protein